MLPITSHKGTVQATPSGPEQPSALRKWSKLESRAICKLGTALHIPSDNAGVWERERKKCVGLYSNIASFLQCHFPAFEVHFNISCSKVSPSFHPSLLSDMNPSSSFSLQFSLCRNQHKLTCTYEEQQNNLPMCIDSASILKHLSGPRFPFLMYGLLFVLPLFSITPKSTLRHK